MVYPHQLRRTSLAAPAQIAAWIRGHWGIEARHHIRERHLRRRRLPDPHRQRPQVMSALRNLGIAIPKPGGYPSIAAACRYHARDATRTLATLGLSPA